MRPTAKRMRRIERQAVALARVLESMKEHLPAENDYDLDPDHNPGDALSALASAVGNVAWHAATLAIHFEEKKR